jgi:nitrite reductase/ring-hydroxylating ferredoxin subunit
MTNSHPATVRGATPWPRYEAAAGGLPDYWYPVAFSRNLGRRPLVLQVLGEPVMLLRDGGKAYAVRDQCPHRGVPLSLGKQEFPCTWTCRYHGWTFDLPTGELGAALSDGPRSAICGKVRVRTYPVEERAGLVWIYLGCGTPPPVEDDIPDELLRRDVVVVGRISERPGNWRYAAENGWDSSHALYLHRDAWFIFFRKKPVWGMSRIAMDDDGWLTRYRTESHFQDDYPRYGRWPKPRPWEVAGGAARVSIRLPGMLRVRYPFWTHYEWYVPLDRGHHRYLQLVVKPATGLAALAFRLEYYLYIRALFHGHFNGQDAKMVEYLPEDFPERLFRPDASITSWRRLFDRIRGAEPALAPDLPVAADLAAASPAARA